MLGIGDVFHDSKNPDDIKPSFHNSQKFDRSIFQWMGIRYRKIVNDIGDDVCQAMIQLKHQRLVIPSQWNNQQIDFREMALIYALFSEECHSNNLVRPNTERSLSFNSEPRMPIPTTSF
jgi:hypothetical protein